MALSRPFSHHLKPFLDGHYAATLRLISFSTPAEAAAARRRRKELLGMEPPLASLRDLQPPPSPDQHPFPAAKNPSIPKLPEPASALCLSRLVLHNQILSHIRDGDLNEADLLVRHSIYSNCRPTIFTCNAVLAALLRHSRLVELLALHRFITQANIAPNIATHNLLLQAYCERGQTDTALEHYRILLRGSPLPPSPTTYRILVKCLLRGSRIEEAILLKDDMLDKAPCPPDPTVYDLLMSRLIADGRADRALALYVDLKEKLRGRPLLDGVVYGSLMKAYFQKGMEKEAIDCYNEALGEGSNVKFNTASYNSVLQALSKNGKFDEALLLFERMAGEHRPPQKLTLNVGCFNTMVDGYCDNGRFQEAIAVFHEMSKRKCNPDTMSFNNLIKHLGSNCMIVQAEELYREMGERGIEPNEATYVLLMDACFRVSRIDDATGYFNKMVESGLRPNTAAHSKAIEGLVYVGRLNEAKGYFNMMVEKRLKLDVSSCEMLLQSFCEAGMLDDALMICKGILLDENALLRPQIKELVEVALRKEAREDELGKLYDEVEREKAEALARQVEEKARARLLAREEAQRKRAEAAAEKEATAKKSSMFLEEILASTKSLETNRERNDESLSIAAATDCRGALKEVMNISESGNDTKDGEGFYQLGNPERSEQLRYSDEETRSRDGTPFESVTV